MHKQLEDYLAQVAQQIVSIPKPRRDEELKEMNAHLISAVAANQEQGQTEDAAVASALKAFGTPAEASANVLSAWRAFVRKNSRKTFWKIGGIWSVFYAFQLLFLAKASDLQLWLSAWGFTWLICALFILVPPYFLRSSSQSIRSSVRQRR